MDRRIIKLSIRVARNSNRQLLYYERITPVPNIHGTLPPVGLIPLKGDYIHSMTLETVDQLLHFYEIASCTEELDLNRKISRLCSHWGFHYSAR